MMTNPKCAYCGKEIKINKEFYIVVGEKVYHIECFKKLEQSKK